MNTLRRLTDSGTDVFAAYIASLASDGNLTPPFGILEGEELSEPVAGGATVEDRQFEDSMEAGEYLLRSLVPLSEEALNDPGLWNWLALYYFDQLCPVTNGQRKPAAVHRYILSPDFRKGYRHLLATPFRLVRLHGTHAQLMLKHPVHVHSDLTEQLASRQEIMTNRGIIEAAALLYYDEDREAPKRNASNRTVRGSARRLVALSQQLDLTYDLYSMNGAQVLDLLPEEFDRWR